MKNAPKTELPEGFFDAPDINKSIKLNNEVNNPLQRLQTYSNENDDDEEDDGEDDVANNIDQKDIKVGDDNEDGKSKPNSDLPEGFFDDPVLDAKVSAKTSFEIILSSNV